MRAENKVFPFLTCALAVCLSSTAYSDQPASDHASHHPQGSASATPSQNPLAPLQKALDKNPPSASKNKKPPRPKGGMKGMNTGGSGGGGMMGKGMMDHMNQMGQMMLQMGKPPEAMTSSATSSELPGFPGASHIYHIGATGFFLDHQDITSLTPEQQTALNGIKEAALSNQSTSERKIDQAEQELWLLTSSDKPDIASIEAKSKEIESLKTEKRLAFIRAVGEAAKVLTPDQRSILLGRTSPPQQMASPGSPKGSQSTMPPMQKPSAGGMNSGGMMDDQGEMGGMGGAASGNSGAMPQKNSGSNSGMGSMEPGDM